MDSTLHNMHWKLMLNLLNICLITLPKTHFFSIVFCKRESLWNSHITIGNGPCAWQVVFKLHDSSQLLYKILLSQNLYKRSCRHKKSERLFPEPFSQTLFFQKEAVKKGGEIGPAWCSSDVLQDSLAAAKTFGEGGNAPKVSNRGIVSK